MIYQKARKIHRFFMFVTIVLTGVMWFTGEVMKEGWTVIDPFFARRLHRGTSNFFSFSLFLMIASGLVMYLSPLFKKRK